MSIDCVLLFGGKKADPMKGFVGKCKPKGKVNGAKEIKNYHKKSITVRKEFL